MVKTLETPSKTSLSAPHAPFIPAGRGQSCAAREVASRSGFLASFALNRTVRRHAKTTDNAGLSVVLLLGGRMADMIEQNRENIANEDAAGSCRTRPHPQMLFSCYDGLAARNHDLGNMAEAERYVCSGAGSLAPPA